MEIDEKQVSDPERYVRQTARSPRGGRRAQDGDMMRDMPAMMLIGALFWIAIILATGASVWWAIRRGWPTRRDPALDVLRERYARGRSAVTSSKPGGETPTPDGAPLALEAGR